MCLQFSPIDMLHPLEKYVETFLLRDDLTLLVKEDRNAFAE